MSALPTTVLNADTRAQQLDPDLKEAERFLDRLDAKAKFFTFQTFDDRQGDRKDPALSRILHGPLEEHGETLTELNRRGAGIFVTVSATDGSGRRKENIVEVRAVWQEADHGDVPRLPVQAHIEVESSPGKFHRYILTNSSKVEEFAAVQERLVSDYGSDPNAKDLSRVLRVPGFYHQKAAPHMVRLVEVSNKPPLPWEDVKVSFPPVEQTGAQVDQPPGLAQSINVREVKDALAVLEPDESYEQWITVGMALRSIGHPEAFTLWDEWSKRGAKYDESETATKWNSFNQQNGGITIRTLFYLATQAGFQRTVSDETVSDSHIDFVNRTYTVEEAFDACPDIDREEFEKTHPEPKPFTILLNGFRYVRVEDKIKDVVNNALLKAFNDINQDHAATKYEGKPAVIHEHKDPTFGHDSFTSMKPSDAKKWAESEPGYRASVSKDGLKIKQVNIMDAWWKWPGRREYPKGIVMAPNANPEGAYNAFQGFQCYEKYIKHILLEGKLFKQNYIAMQKNRRTHCTHALGMQSSDPRE